MQYKHLFASLTALLPLISCSTEESTERTSQPTIVGGSLLPNSHPLGGSTVALVSTTGPRPESFCTGTLVAANLVVTAAHCLEGMRAENMGVFFGERTPNGEVRRISSFAIHPSYNFPQGDIGWVKLSERPPASARISKVLKSPQPTVDLRPGTRLILAGYGLTGTGQTRTGGTRNYVEMPVRQYAERSEEGAHLIIFGANQGKGACNGDSGGPAYLAKDGQYFLVGVTNGKTAKSSTDYTRCETDGVIYTYVDGYSQWIEQTSGVKLTYR